MKDQYELLIMENQLQELSQLIDDGKINIDYTTAFNETLLHLSIKYDRMTLFDYLLKQDTIKLHTQSFSCGTPLVAAIYFERFEMFNKLIEKEFDTPDSFTSERHPGLLLTAVRINRTDFVSRLLEIGVDINSAGEANFEEPPYGFDNDGEPTPFDIYGPPVFELPVIVAMQDECPNALSTLLRHHPNMTKIGKSGYSADKLFESKCLKKDIIDIITEYKNLPARFSPGFFTSISNKDTKDKEHCTIPPELASAFEGAFDLLYQEFIETTSEEEKRILISILQDPQYSVQQVSNYFNTILSNPSLSNSVDILYCALHPEKWEETPFENHKLCLIDNTAKYSLPTDTEQDTLETYIQHLIDKANEIVKAFFPENILLSSDEEQLKKRYLENTSSSLSSESDESETSLLLTYLDTYNSDFRDQLENKPTLTTVITKQSNMPLELILTDFMDPKNKPWNKLPQFSKTWGKIYELIKYPTYYHRQRNEKYMYKVIRAIIYKESNQIPWSQLPQSFIDRGRVYYYYNLWFKNGKLNEILKILQAVSLNDLQEEKETKTSTEATITIAIVSQESATDAPPCSEQLNV